MDEHQSRACRHDVTMFRSVNILIAVCECERPLCRWQLDEFHHLPARRAAGAGGAPAARRGDGGVQLQDSEADV